MCIFFILAMCSAIKNQFNTFNDNILNFRDYLKDSCSLLLVAECSENPQYAVILNLLPNGLYAFKVYYKEHFAEYNPTNEAGLHTIIWNGNQTMKLENSPLPLPEGTLT